MDIWYIKYHLYRPNLYKRTNIYRNYLLHNHIDLSMV